MNKKIARIRRGFKHRCHLKRLSVRRLLVHRTSRHIYAQVISSDNSRVLVSASTLEREIRGQLTITSNKYAAALVGRVIAERALKCGIFDVSFDRSGFRYHGRVRELAEASRKFGMRF